jgi:phospholipase/carboxylesterase
MVPGTFAQLGGFVRFLAKILVSRDPECRVGAKRMNNPNQIGFEHRFIESALSRPRVLLLLHGTGGDENDMVPLGRDLDPSAALLSLRGNVLENGMPRFFRRLAEGIFDEKDVVRRANELADFIPDAAAKYNFDPQQVTAVGYSNGANIAAAVLFLRPGTLTSAVLLRAMVPLTPPTEPALTGRRVLICSGTRDPIIPLENAKRLAAMLQSAGADVTHRFEEAGHQLVFDEIAAAKNWLSESSRA